MGDDCIIIIQFKRFCFSPQRQKLSVLKALAINQGRVRLTILRTTNKWNKCLKWLVLVLLHLFWNGCWSLQSDRLSAKCMISSWINVFFLDHSLFLGNERFFARLKSSRFYDLRLIVSGYRDRDRSTRLVQMWLHLHRDSISLKSPSIREVASVIGKIVSSFPGVMDGALYYRHLEKDKSQALDFL